jgi:hypothetical protein
VGVQDQARASGLGYFFSQGANNPIYFCKKKNTQATRHLQKQMACHLQA